MHRNNVDVIGGWVYIWEKSVSCITFILKPTDLCPPLLLSLGDTEEAIAASALDSSIQQMVGEGGQRVITIVTDQHGNLQTAGGLSQPFFVTMQHGQQSKSVNMAYKTLKKTTAVSRQGCREGGREGWRDGWMDGCLKRSLL